MPPYLCGMIRVSVVDPNKALWSAVARRLRGAVLGVLPDNPAPETLANSDAIVFPAAGAAHADVQQALGLKKLVLIAMDDELAAASDNDSRKTIVNPDRYLPSCRLIRQQLDAGKLGAPGLMRMHRWEPANLLTRDLDLVLWYFGTAPNAIHAVANTACTQVHLGFPGGGMALIDQAGTLPAGDRYYSLSLIGAHGAAYADDHANAQLLFQGGAPRAPRADEAIAQWTALLQEFVDAVAHDSNRAASFPPWNDVLAVRAAIARDTAGAKRGGP